MKLLVKHRYSYINADTGERVETRFHMTAEAAAGAKMQKAVLIPETREEHFIADVPDTNRFARTFHAAENR